MTTELDRRTFIAGLTALPMAAHARAGRQQEERVSYVREEAEAPFTWLQRRR